VVRYTAAQVAVAVRQAAVALLQKQVATVAHKAIVRAVAVRAVWALWVVLEQYR
jgi:hypothetical protein